MPPGTGDIQLTLSQSVPVTGAVIATTPQDIALLDARKGVKMFEKVGVPILGVVENMSIHICSKCGHEEHIFGQGGGEKMCADFNIPFLGALPLDIQIRTEADGGTPTVVADPDGRIASTYKQIARKVAVRIAERSKDMTHKFPNIVIKNTWRGGDAPRARLAARRGGPGRRGRTSGPDGVLRCSNNAAAEAFPVAALVLHYAAFPTGRRSQRNRWNPRPCPSSPTSGSAAWPKRPA